MAIKADQPAWARQALQGIAYWIGHRRSVYPHYPLSEGALVGEICNLVYAQLPENFELRCEIAYSSFLNRQSRGNDLSERARADLVIFESGKGSKDRDTVRFVIEVKRGKAPNSQIDADLRRLAMVKNFYPEIRTFMFLISEAQRPKRFVNAAGSSILGKHLIKGSTGYFRVRRTLKAAHAFNFRDRAQYACLIEVYA